MSTCPASVRIATPQDREDLFEFVWSAHEETRFATKDAGKVHEIVDEGVRTQRNPVFGIIRGPDGIEAACGLLTNELWYSRESVLMSFLFHVLPEFRAPLPHAMDLTHFAVWFAAQLGMPLILLDYSAKETGKTRLFARYARRVGTMFGTAGQVAA